MNKIHYLVAVREERGRLVSHVLRRRGNENLVGIFDKRTVSINICDSKKEAYDIAEYWNRQSKSKYGKIETIYTGGGIWISAMYYNENIYAVVSNDWEDFNVGWYDDRKEDPDTEYACTFPIDSNDVPGLTKAEEKKIQKKLVAELKEWATDL